MISESKRYVKEESKTNSLHYSDVNLFYKYCVNRIRYDDFLEIMMEIHTGSEKYVEDKWPSFRDDPFKFIVSRSEEELFNIISDKIIKTKYKG